MAKTIFRFVVIPLIVWLIVFPSSQVLAFNFGSLATRSIPISELKNNVREYNGKKVQVTGFVKKRFGLLLKNAFVLSSEDGDTIVIYTSKAMPRLGDEMTVSGVFYEAFSAGSYTLPIVEEF